MVIHRGYEIERNGAFWFIYLNEIWQHKTETVEQAKKWINEHKKKVEEINKIH